MNTLKLYLQEGRITGFDCQGHTGYAEQGEDIVCAAISAITGAAVIGLERVANIKAKVKTTDAHLHCALPDDLEELQELQVETILRTMLYGVQSIERQYPEHVSIKILEA